MGRTPFHDFIVMATLAMLCATATRGAPLPGKDLKTMVARAIRSECFVLMEYSSTLYGELESSRFKNGDFNHHVSLGQGIVPVVDYGQLSNQEFLKRNIILIYRLHQMVQEIIQYESQQNRPDNFKQKFGEVEYQIHDIYSWLHHMEKISNLPLTAVTTSQFPTPTVKPQATQKEHDEWSMMVLHELSLSLIALQRGMAEKYLMN